MYVGIWEFCISSAFVSGGLLFYVWRYVVISLFSLAYVLNYATLCNQRLWKHTCNTSLQVFKCVFFLGWCCRGPSDYPVISNTVAALKRSYLHTCCKVLFLPSKLNHYTNLLHIYVTCQIVLNWLYRWIIWYLWVHYVHV